MESPPSSEQSSAELVSDQKPRSTPYSQQTVTLPKQAYIDLKWQASYWRSQYKKCAAREAALKAEIEIHQATIRDLKQRLYGRKSERSTTAKHAGRAKSTRRRNRGQQPGSLGHGRRDHSGLRVVTETHDVGAAETSCSICGNPLHPFPGSEDSHIIEIQVQAHVRRIQRQRYRRTCRCERSPGIVSAPPAPRLIPKTSLGVSVWTEVLLDKYLYGRPTSRLCQALEHQDVPLAQGTVTGGLQKLSPLFDPLMDALHERQMSEKVFHCDETHWNVFEGRTGRSGHRWYLWVTRSPSVVFYQAAPSRGAAVPKAHFRDLRRDLAEVVIVCDRYRAYQSLAKDHRQLVLAYCWAHMRRDFLDAARSWPKLEAWMWSWLRAIRTLYRLNSQRLAQWDETSPLAQQSPAFFSRHQTLVDHVDEMQTRCKRDRQETDLHVAKRQVLDSLHHHWEGLTIFVERPEVAMDNNAAERALRLPVVGRKTYYGSGRIWSAHLAAKLFSVLQTMKVWNLNPRHWLSSFLHACAANGGACPADLSPFLPWQLNDEPKRQLSHPEPTPWVPTGPLLQAPARPVGSDTS